MKTSELLESYYQGCRSFPNLQAEGIELEHMSLAESSLHQANFKRAIFSYADLSSANLTQANLRIAKLNYTNLAGAVLHQADLVGADFSQANLTRADLTGTRLDLATLKGAFFTSETTFPEGFDPAKAGLVPALPVLNANWIQLKNFLSSEQVQQLLDFINNAQPGFVPTALVKESTTTAIYHRKSKYSTPSSEFKSIIVSAIHQVFDEVTQQLSIPTFLIDEIEAEVTSHNDGDFYKAHTDDGPPSVASRILTYVYYFHRQPKAFTGGALKIYDTQSFLDSPVKGGRSVTIEPYHNSIVFFPSYFIHEVLPIQCPSREFMDSRFTINGWLRQVRQ
ncbi:MAG: hypothetical protein HC921_01780 [Synechococcaceae cyanobacterium SM2_3_1]|nr:hypothetical protein [Synechococcaceae cyanobacterium SM2_3_1]